MLQLKRKTHLLFLLFIGINSFNLYAQNTEHWETILKPGDICQYFIPTSEIGTNWTNLDFDDSNWISAKSGIGFGDDDDSTIIAEGISSIYIRYSFNVENLSEISSLIIDMDYDDGFVAYLNGREVARSNIENPISWNMELNAFHEAALYQGEKPDRFSLNSFLSKHLKTGENILSVEIHNHSSESSDLSSNVFLHAQVKGDNNLYSETSEWFWTPTDYTKLNLPIMLIHTNGQTIPEDTRIVADMGLIYNGEGILNSELDIWNEYSGKISIEKRGESSKEFRKRSFGIELQMEDGSNNNVSILGLPEENDFVLHGPYSDKTLIKNVLTFEIYRLTGRWAPRTRFIEVFLNGQYNGVYVLMEKIKRDKNRVVMDKINEKDITEEEISGGYLLRRDKKGHIAPEDYWTSLVGQPYHVTNWYEYYDPKIKDLTASQSNYIIDWMTGFDEVMAGDNFNDPNIGYRKYIKTRSFIDMMFINEISKGVDNYIYSTYFYKENDNDGGQLNAGPPWDYNVGYGNVNYGEDWDVAETYGWMYPQRLRNYWFERLMEDESYRNQVYCRWTDFRDNIYSTENIVGIIDSCVTVLGDAVDRNFEKFPLLGVYYWPAIYYPDTYEEEIDSLKNWLTDRLAWMDSEWYNMGNCSDFNTDVAELNNVSSIKVYPNPSDFSNLHFEMQLASKVNRLSINIFDVQGRLITQRIIENIAPGRNVYQFSDLNNLNPGIYIYKIYDNNSILSVGKLSKI